MNGNLLDRVRAAVNEVSDPCSVAQGVPTGLLDMGLLCDINLGSSVGGRQDVVVQLRLTAPGCFYAVYFEREIRARLEEMPDVAQVDVEFSRNFDWSPDDIAPHIQQRLRDRRERLIAQLDVVH